MILIDTDIAIDIWRGRPQAIAWLASLGARPIFAPGFVAMELLSGCRNSGELRIAEKIISRFGIVWPDAASCATALQVYKSVHLSNAIGILDSMIGQTAIAMRLPLHTFNHRHFKAIPGLTTIQPY